MSHLFFVSSPSHDLVKYGILPIVGPLSMFRVNFSSIPIDRYELERFIFKNSDFSPDVGYNK